MPNPTPWSSLSRRGLLAGVTLTVALAVLAGTAALPGAAVAAAASLEIGQPAPDFSVADTNGIQRSLAALKGKIVVLEWTNADCPFTKKHYVSSNMQTLQAEAAAAGVVWLSIISSAPGQQGYVSASDANALTVGRHAAPAGVVLDPDGKLGHAYGALTTPHMFIIGADGRLRYMGGIDSIVSTKPDDVAKAQPYFRDALRAVIQGQPVQLPVTRPYGCGVKYAP